MDKSPAVLFFAVIFVIALGVLMSIAGGQHGATFVLPITSYSIAVFTFCGVLAFFINWVCYVPAAIYKTEKYYDLVGSITYLSLIATALYFSPEISNRAKLVSLMVVLWALRLGTFLFNRIHKAGSDDRFDEVKVNPLKFLLAWSLQALWVLLTLACALVIITSEKHVAIGGFAITGCLLWLVGFTVEVIADRQKAQFRKKPSNKGKFISTGLWAWSQHPNYFGEILLWLGMSIIAIPIMVGGQWFALISPVFVYLLLTKGSGIPTLQEKADKLWSDDVEYLAYIKRTPVFSLHQAHTITMA